MKKYTSLFVSLLLTFQVLLLNGQSLMVAGDNSVLTSDACLQTSAYLEVKNISNKEQEILCVKNVMFQPAGATNHFCWGGSCYGPSQDTSGSSLILQAGEGNTTSFTGYFDAFCDLGVAAVEYCFYPINDITDMSCIMVTYHGEATEISENKNQFTVSEFYPNPAKEHTTINYKSGENVYLNIIDILGNKVKTISLSNTGTQDIYVGDLSKGIYFGNLVHNDKEIGIKKLILE